MLDESEGPRGQTDNLIVTVAATAILVGIVAFITGAVVAPPILNSGKPWLYDYQTLVTGLLAVLAALGATWAAWVGIRTQLRHAEEMRAFPEKRAKAIFTRQFLEFAKCLSFFWLDVLRYHDGECTLQGAFMKFDFVSKELGEADVRAKQICDLLAPLDKIEANELIHYLNFYISECERNRDFDESDFGDHFRGAIVLTMLSHLREAMRRFDDALIRDLQNLRGIDVDWDPMSVHMEAVNEWQSTRNIISND